VGFPDACSSPIAHRAGSRNSVSYSPMLHRRGVDLLPYRHRRCAAIAGNRNSRQPTRKEVGAPRRIPRLGMVLNLAVDKHRRGRRTPAPPVCSASRHPRPRRARTAVPLPLPDAVPVGDVLGVNLAQIAAGKLAAATDAWRGPGWWRGARRALSWWCPQRLPFSVGRAPGDCRPAGAFTYLRSLSHNGAPQSTRLCVCFPKL
jgi:hypothetical protein